MPLYEYESPDGTRIELMRPMSEADAPVEDPEGKGRTFSRVLSAFAARGAAAGGAGAGGGSAVSGGCCPCGKQRGSCSAN